MISGLRLQSIRITDLALDPGTLAMAVINPMFIPTGSTSFSLPASALSTSMIMPPGGQFVWNNHITIDDLSHVNSATRNTLGYIPESDNGNIQTITSFGGSDPYFTFYLNIPTVGDVAVGDVIGIFTKAATIDIELSNNIQINNLSMMNGAGITLGTDTNYIVSNNLFNLQSELAEFQCLGALAVGDWGADSQYGFIVNNTFVNGTMEMDGYDTIMSGNLISPFCQGIGGSIGGGNYYQGNVISNSPFSLSVTVGDIASGYQQIIFYENYWGLRDQSLQVWNSNSAIVDNLIFNNAAGGIISGGSNNIVARNVVYDTAESYYFQSGQGGSGIMVEGPNDSNINSNNILTNNVSCNTNGNNTNPASPNCNIGPGATAGSQKYGLDIGQDSNHVSLATDNQFYPGYVAGDVGPGVKNNAGPGIAINQSSTLPEGTISVTSCAVNSNTGSCTGQVQWTTANLAQTASVYVSNSAQSPACIKLMATDPSGNLSIPWIQNNIYVFTLVDAQGLTLDSATLQPTNYSTLGPGVYKAAWPGPCI
jgi:hypothetical protein